MSQERDTDGPLRVGIFGTGTLGRVIGRQFHSLPGSTVVALADVDETNLAEAGEELGVGADGLFDDHSAMLAEVDLDAVLITTPHALHDEQITAALDRGLHVLCEKPMVIDGRRARELAARVADSDQVLMVGYQRHLDRAFQRVRERYAGRDRQPRFVTAEITQNWMDAFEGTWRMDPELSGGGFLTDTGRHVVDAVLWTTGLEPTAVTAELEFGDPEIDHTAHLRIEFASGATAAVSLYGDAPAVRESCHVWDDDGAAYVDGRGWGKRNLQFVDDEGSVYDPILDRDSERNKAEAFLAAVRGEAPPPATPTDAVRATAVVEAAYASAASGERAIVDLE